MDYDQMTPQLYDKDYFCFPLPYSVVEKNKEEYAKIFSEGSLELEKFLLDSWNCGLQTWACGIDADDRIEHFHLDIEKKILKRFDKYLKSNSVAKLFMNKDKYIPQFRAYISFESDSIKDMKALKKAFRKAMEPYRKDCHYTYRHWKVDEKQKISFHINVPRNRECTYHMLDKMTPEEALQSSLPERDRFDILFSAMRNGLKEYCKEISIPFPADKKVAISSSSVFCENSHPEKRTASLDEKIADVKRREEHVQKEKSRDFGKKISL